MIQSHDIPAPPPRPSDGHKGTFGTVIVVGGCAAMIGAPALCARAAFRGGVGRVQIACPAQVLPHALTIEPCATGIALTGRLDADLAAIDTADPEARAVVALGPGLGEGQWQRGLVGRLLAGPRRVVLDADGLNALATSLRRSEPLPAWQGDTGDGSEGVGPARVFTPHPGEFRRLAGPLGIGHDPTDVAQRPAAATALARATRSVVLLKGRGTVVSDRGRYAVNTTGNPALAVAGSGDVLTGLLAALITQGLSAFEAAVLAAHAHGLAADGWAQAHGPSGLRAPDLADAIPGVLKTLRQPPAARP